MEERENVIVCSGGQRTMHFGTTFWGSEVLFCYIFLAKYGAVAEMVHQSIMSGKGADRSEERHRGPRRLTKAYVRGNAPFVLKHAKSTAL